jgi:hypothetical protein
MNTTIIRLGALVLAAALCTAETRLLLQSLQWTDPQFMVIVSATVSLAVAPLLFKEVRPWLRVACWVGCFGLAAFVFVSVLDRSAHSVDIATATGESVAESRGRLEAELASARDSLRHAEAKVKEETENGGCGKMCRSWQSLEKTYQTAVDGYTSKLDALAPVVANAGAKRYADITGYTIERVLLYWPVTQPLAFQIAIWVFMGVASGHWFAGTIATVPAVPIVSEPENSEAGGGGKGLRLVSVTEDREITALKNALAGKRSLNNNELARAMSVEKAEASRRVTKAQELGIVSRVRTGRHVAISLHAH